MKFNIRNIDFVFRFWFFAVMALFAALDAKTLSLYFALPVIIHECGHLVVMAACGARVKSIYFTAFGVDIRRDAAPLSYGREIAVNLGGAAFNLLAALCLHVFAFHSMRVMLLVSSNIAIAVFNLLPIGSLDGGMLARLVTERYFNMDFAFFLSKLFSFAALVPLFAASIFLLLQPERNFTLLVVCAYLLMDVIFVS